jgi:hypothetical protein
MIEIFQIVPKLPPSISGVGDYAMLLARELQSNHGIDSHFLSVSDRGSPETANDFPVNVIHRRASSLVEALRGKTLVCLHYVGYGYQKRGYAVWLARGLRTWKHENGNSRLITMFHEIFATGRIWNSSFWLSRLQRGIACGIANTSDALLTNRQAYADTLAQFAPRLLAPVVIPVLSTVGETPAINDGNDRQPWLVVFGGDDWAHRAFTLYTDAIKMTCDQLHIDRVIQIGSSVNHRFDYRPVEVEGVLPAEEISRILCKSKAGFLSYYPGYLSKSTIFAAYCAHGVVPIFPTENNSERDGLFRGTHYLLPADLRVLDIDSILSSIRRNIREWYQQHDLKRTAKIFAETLKISPA